MKKVLRGLITALLISIFIPGIVLAVSNISGAVYRFAININNSSVAATNVSTIAAVSTPNLIAGGYCNAGATNMVVRDSTGADVPFMPGLAANPWVIWVPSIGANSYTTDTVYLANSTGGLIRYFPGDTGMVTANDASLQLGTNFILEYKGYIDTTAGADKWILYRDSSLGIKVDGTTNGKITAGLLTNATDFDGTAKVVATGITPGIHTVQVGTTAGTSAMKQPFLLVDTYGVRTNTTQYLPVRGTYNAGEIPTQNSNPFLVTTAGTFGNLSVVLSDAPGAGETAVLRLWKNNATTTLTCTIADANTTGSDAIHTVSVVAGDVLELKSIGSTSCANATLYTSMVFESASVSTSIYSTGYIIIKDGTTTHYSTMEGDGQSITLSTVTRSVIPTDGYISKLYIHLDPYDPGTGNTVTETLYVNELPTALTCTISDTNTDGNNVANTIAVAAGDIVYWRSNFSGIYEGDPITGLLGWTFTAILNGESIAWIRARTDGSLNGITTYSGVSGTLLNYTSTGLISEDSVKQLGVAGSLYNLYGLMEAAGSTGAVVPNLMVNGVASTLTTSTIAYPAQVGHDTVHSASVANGDYIDTETYFDTGWQDSIIVGSYVYYIPDATVDITFSIDGVLKGTAPIPTDVNNSGANWYCGMNGAMSYIEYSKTTVSGILKQSIVWEYGAVFNDLTAYNNDATPSFRTTSSNANVTTTVSDFGPVTQSNAPSYLSGVDDGIFISHEAIPGTFSSTTVNPTDPLFGLIKTIATAGAVPEQIPINLLAGFIILAISLSMSAFARNSGVASTLLKTILIGVIMGIFIATGVFDMWMLLFFGIMGVAIVMVSRRA